MPRPFPFALGIGTDICAIGRVHRLITKHGHTAQNIIRRMLNETERREHMSKLQYAEELDIMKMNGKKPSDRQRKDMTSKSWALAVFLSGRWAAKEAAIKAHSWRRVTLHDITILGSVQSGGRTGAPTMTIKGRSGGEERVAKISISHDGEYATAVCLAAEEAEELNDNLQS